LLNRTALRSQFLPQLVYSALLLSRKGSGALSPAGFSLWA